MANAVKTVTIVSSTITFGGGSSFITMQNLGTNPIYFVTGSTAATVGGGLCLPTQFSSFTIDNKMGLGTISVIASGGSSDLAILSDSKTIV